MLKSSMSIPALLISAVLGITSTSAVAEYVGPGSHPVETSLATILKNPIDDQNVKLEGYLLRKLSKDKYLFSDGTNEIHVEIDKKKIPNKKFDDKQKITIYGEVDKDRKGIEIDVSKVIIQ